MKRIFCLSSVLIAVFLLCTLLFVQADERQKIIDAPWFEWQAAEGVTIKTYHFADLFGGPQDVYVAEIDMDQPGISLHMPYRQNEPRETVSAFAGEVTDAAVAINGNFFDSAGSVQYLKVDNELVCETKPDVADETGIGIDADGEVNIFVRPSEGWASLTDQVSLMTSNTNVLHNGEEWPHWHHHYDFYYVDRHPRTMLGKTDDNRLLMVAVDGRSARAAGMTYHQLAEMMIALGAVNCAGLDGGGSTTMWVRDEPGNGVINQPSDGDQRTVANALVISAPPVTETPEFDARFVSAEYETIMPSEGTQTVTLAFQNYGSETWDSSVMLATTEETGRASAFYDSETWESASLVTGMTEENVEPMGIGHFTFTLAAPHVSNLTDYIESFGLVRDETEYFGPQQNQLSLTVVPDLSGETIIIESRPGGQNYSMYEEEGGWADSGASCTAFGLTPDIGMRYGSTYRSVAGYKAARFRPYLMEEGEYRVSVCWGAAGNRRSPISYVVSHRDGEEEFMLDQTVNENQWIELGNFFFAAGSDGYVQVSNSSLDLSGSMYTAGCMFEPLDIEPSCIVNWSIFE